MKKTMKKLGVSLLGVMLLFSTLGTVQAEEHLSAETPAAELRSSLDHLLSEHFVLAVLYMTKSYDDAEDWEDVWKALDQNASVLIFLFSFIGKFF